jgi:hypothetical protein
MILKRWKVAAFAMLISSTLLAGCQTENAGNASKKTLKTETSQEAQKESVKVSLKEQGYTIDTVISYGENINIVSLTKDGKEYAATIDDNFNWLMKPTDKYSFGDLDFSDGLAIVSVPETREMILAEDPDAKLYGYINTKGEWVIEPLYRYANEFSNGVAVVSTVEEDRDDLSNSKTIIIDPDGNQIGELDSSGLDKLSLDDGDYFQGSFLGEYLYTTLGFFDKQGKYREVYEEAPEDSGDFSNFLVLDKKIIEVDDEDHFNIRKLDGTLIKTTDKTGTFTTENAENLIENNLLLVGGDIVGGEGDAIVDSDLHVKFEPDGFDNGLAEDLIYIGESKKEIEDIGYANTGNFYDYSGEKVFSVTDMIGAVYGDKYFRKGNEYFELVDVNGKVVIDESMKITDTEAVIFDEGGEDNTPYKNLVRIEYRENAEDSEPNEALLNVDTLEIKDIEDLLNDDVDIAAQEETKNDATNTEKKEVAETEADTEAVAAETANTETVEQDSSSQREHKIDYWSFVEVLTHQIDLTISDIQSVTEINEFEELIGTLNQSQDQLEGLVVPDDAAYQNYHEKLLENLPPIITILEDTLKILKDGSANEEKINHAQSNLDYQLFLYESNNNDLNNRKHFMQEKLKQNN